MLDIYIYADRSGSYTELGEMCFKYLISQYYEAEVYYLAKMEAAVSAAVYMIPLNNDTKQLSQLFRSANKGNYIVVLIDNAADFKRAVTPSISPSGLLIRPWDKTDVKMLLDELYSDYKRSGAAHSDPEMFRFRQKAKEYALPYERILYFESRNKKITVRTDAQEFEFYDTLDSILSSAPEAFMKIHKSFVVNISRITAVDYGALTVEFDEGSIAFMSRKYKNELKARIVEGSGSDADIIHNG